MKKWGYCVTSCMQASESAPLLLRGGICENLRKAAEMGYDAVEIHLRENEPLDYDAVRAVMEETKVSVAMVATGRLNTEGGGSLMDDRRWVEETTMEGMRNYIDMAEKLGAGVIIGWVKGLIPEQGNREKYIGRLGNNMKALDSYAGGRGVQLVIEGINHYESNNLCSIREIAEFIRRFQLKNTKVHLDTYHMWLEEEDPYQAILACGSLLGYVHLADSTRRHPGTGQFDFKKILKTLEDSGYDGYLSVECLPWPDGDTAARNAITFLKKLE